MTESPDSLQRQLGIEFNDKSLLELALTHKSYASEHNLGSLDHNERLEFLGDAVLELVVSEELFVHFPEEPEGHLTHWRSVLVNTQSLAQAARELDLTSFLRLSRGESSSQGAQKDSILAGAFEAVMGAIYRDQGLGSVQEIVDRILLPKIPDILEISPQHNPKGYFQEQAQEATGITPEYKVLSERGPDHNKEFEVGVYIGEEQVAKGVGSSKQEAETSAAQNALEAKGWL